MSLLQRLRLIPLGKKQRGGGDCMRRLVLLFGCLVMSSSVSKAEDAILQGLTAYTPQACGICLAKVVAVEDIDDRPTDGNLVRVLKLEIDKSTGLVSDRPGNIIAWGGSRHPNRPPPPLPKLAVTPEIGKSYWFVFQQRYVFYRPANLISVWDVEDSNGSRSLKRAVESDVLKWKPIADAELGIDLGHFVDSRGEWSIRVTRAGKILWDRKVRGEMLAKFFGFYRSGIDDVPVALPTPGKVVHAASRVQLKQGNEFGLAEGTYDITRAFNAISGKHCATYIREQSVLKNVLFVEYDQNEMPIREHRFEYLKRVGNLQTRLRKTVQIDPATRKRGTTQTYRYGQTLDGSYGWIKLLE